MTVREVAQLLNAAVVWGDEELLQTQVHTACGSDMMSDVLAYVKDQSLLLTGLVNSQVIRTAEMMDVVCIVFVRNKLPDEGMIALAQARRIGLLSTSMRMFTACGTLYAHGLEGGLTDETP